MAHRMTRLRRNFVLALRLHCLRLAWFRSAWSMSRHHREEWQFRCEAQRMLSEATVC